MVDQKTFQIELGKGSERDLEWLPHGVKRTVLLEIQKWLTRNPFQQRKTRIKRLSGYVPPLYRLRIGDYRAYYRIIENQVAILAICTKKIATDGLDAFVPKAGDTNSSAGDLSIGE